MNRHQAVFFVIVPLALLCMLSSTVTAQQSRMQSLKVQSCGAADSILGAVGADRKAEVRGNYRAAQDDTWLYVGYGGSLSSTHFSGQLGYPGGGVIGASDSAAWQAAKFAISFFVNGEVARIFLAAGALPPATILVDDSVNIIVDAPILGKYKGPAGSTIAPVTLDVTHDRLRLLRADRVEVRLGDHRYVMPPNELRDLRGLFRVAVCAGATGKD